MRGFSDSRMPVCQGGLVLANSMIRACLRGDSEALAITVLSLLDQRGAGITGAAAATMTALTTTAASSLEARFGHQGALDYLDGIDQTARFDAIVNGEPEPD